MPLANITTAANDSETEQLIPGDRAREAKNT